MPEAPPPAAAARTPSLRERFVGGAAWTGSSRLAVNALTLVATVLLARLLDPRDYGLLAMATVFTGLVEQAHDFGVGQALVQKERVTRENEQAAFTVSLLASLAFCAALWLLAGPVAAVYRDDRVAPVLRAIAVAFPIGAFAIVPRALLRRELTLRGEALTGVVTTIGESAVTLLLAWLGYGVWSLVAGRLVASALTAIGVSLARPWRPGLRLRGGEALSLLRFGGGLTLSTFLWYAYSNADFFIVGRALGSAALGTYSMAWKLAKMPWDRLWLSINPIILPLYARARQDPRELGKVVCSLTRYTALLTFPAVAGLGAVADDAVLVLLGERWREAISPLRWLAAYGVARGVIVLLPPVLVAVGWIRKEIAFNAVCAVVLPLGFLAAVRFGPAGVAAAWALLYPALAFAWLAPIALSAAQIAPRSYVLTLARPLAATLAMVAAVAIVGVLLPGGPVRLAVRVVVGALVYLAAVRALEGPLVPEVQRLYRDAREGLRI